MNKAHGFTNKKFRGKYRIPSARLKNYDYASNGGYFVTICTKNREHFFGKVADEEMRLSEIGKITDDCWRKITEHFPFVVLGQWVVMPNHVHGVVIIDKTDCGRDAVCGDGRDAVCGDGRDAINCVSTRGGITKNNNPMLYQNLSTIIRWFKGRTTFEIRKLCPDFSWQPRFHDRIIRDENELHRISQYIIANPANWENDDYY